MTDLYPGLRVICVNVSALPDCMNTGLDCLKLGKTYAIEEVYRLPFWRYAGVTLVGGVAGKHPYDERRFRPAGLPEALTRLARVERELETV